MPGGGARERRVGGDSGRVLGVRRVGVGRGGPTTRVVDEDGGGVLRAHGGLAVASGEGREEERRGRTKKEERERRRE